MSSDFERKVFLENEYLSALKEIEREISKSSDRGTVLICGSVLDGLLGEVLRGFLVEGNKKEEDLFKGKGVLANFDGKIIMAFYLGLINKNEFDNLKHLQKIRNIFAHQVFDISFENNRIKNICLNFNIPKNAYGPRTIPLPDKETNELPKVDMNPIKSDTPAKDRFLYSFYYLFGCLVRKAAISSFEKREELTEILTADEVTKDASKRIERNLKAFTERIEQGRKKYDALRGKIVDKVNGEAQAEALINLEELKIYIDNQEEELKMIEDTFRSMEETSRYVSEVLENSKEN